MPATDVPTGVLGRAKYTCSRFVQRAGFLLWLCHKTTLPWLEKMDFFELCQWWVSSFCACAGHYQQGTNCIALCSLPDKMC